MKSFLLTLILVAVSSQLALSLFCNFCPAARRCCNQVTYSCNCHCPFCQGRCFIRCPRPSK